MFIPLMLGELMFGVDALTFQKISISRTYNIAQSEQIGVNPALQFTGRKAATIDLPGVLYPARLLAEPQSENDTADVPGFGV